MTKFLKNNPKIEMNKNTHEIYFDSHEHATSQRVNEEKINF